MTEADRVRYLRLALRVFGLVFIFGVYPLTIFWPSRLGLASRPVRVPANDHCHLCDAGCLPSAGLERP